MSPTEDDVIDFVVRWFARGVSPQDVILAVCEKRGLNWQEAEEVVPSALVFQKREIAKGQLVVMVLIGLATALGGI